MKRLSLLTALTFAAAGLALAQQPQAPASQQPDQQPAAPITRSYDAPHQGRHQPNPHRQAMMLSRRLNLTPDQTAKLEPILADRDQKIAALRANTSLTPQEVHQQMRALHEQEQGQLASILTPEQQEQLKSMRHGRHGEHHDQGQPTPAV